MAMATTAGTSDASMTTTPTIGPFHDALHTSYIINLGTKLDSPTSYEGAVTEHLRMSGVYWTLAALSLLRNPEEVDECMGLTSSIGTRRAIVDWVFACYDPRTGGFGGNCSGVLGNAGDDASSSSTSDDHLIPHDGHLLYTLSALQILAMANALDDERLNKESIVHFVSGLQNEDGSFSGDEWGEIDTRFTYCAFSCLALLGRLPLPTWSSKKQSDIREEVAAIDVHKAVRYIISCRNFDGGFGSVPGAESHAGQVFCCIGALSIAHSLHLLNGEISSCDGYSNNVNNGGADLLAWWLAERQCDSGGLNGRPEKQADVCYSWWILSALSIMGRVSWIDTSKLGKFILNCQDDDDGGIADRPFDMPDVYHTFFGLCGLSLIGHLEKIGSLEGRIYREIDPIFALPTDVVEKLGLRAQVISNSNGVVEDRLKLHCILDG
jgi:geranylgeranyl transferase type-2 subunit beta